jgi:TPR repeat protein
MPDLRAPVRPRPPVSAATGSRGAAAIAPRLRVPRPVMLKAGPRRDDRPRLVEPVAPAEPSPWTAVSESTPLRSVRPFRQSFLAPVLLGTTSHLPQSPPAPVGSGARATPLRAVDGQPVGSQVAASAVPARTPEEVPSLDQPLLKPSIAAARKPAPVEAQEAVSATLPVALRRAPATSLPLRLAATAPLSPGTKQAAPLSAGSPLMVEPVAATSAAPLLRSRLSAMLRPATLPIPEPEAATAAPAEAEAPAPAATPETTAGRSFAMLRPALQRHLGRIPANPAVAGLALIAIAVIFAAGLYSMNSSGISSGRRAVESPAAEALSSGEPRAAIPAAEASEPERRFADALVRAKAGNSDAQLQVAVLYAKGDGVTQDYETAANWFRAAADQGVARAQYDLGVLYERGRGVPVDLAQAFNWYRKAADNNYALGQFNLAVAYTKGQGTRPDYAQAAAWYSRAAKQGIIPAMVNLAILYERGDGIEPSLENAYAWYRAASRRGNQAAARRSEELLQLFTPAQQSRGEALAGEVQGSIRDAVSERPAAAPSGPAPTLKSALDVKNGGKP